MDIGRFPSMWRWVVRRCVLARCVPPFRRPQRRDHATGSTTRAMEMVICRVHGPSKIKKHTSKQAQLQNENPNLI